MRESSLEKFNRYLLSQAALAKNVPLLQQPSITISRESGAGATTVEENYPCRGVVWTIAKCGYHESL